MYEHKLRPLQTTRSMHSVRSNIEKLLDDGMSFADREEPIGKDMPKQYKKYIGLLVKKQQTDADEQFLEKVRVASENSISVGKPESESSCEKLEFSPKEEVAEAPPVIS